MLLPALVVERHAPLHRADQPGRIERLDRLHAGKFFHQIEQIAAIAIGHGAQGWRAHRRSAAGSRRNGLPRAASSISSAASSSRRSTSTWARDSSAPFSSKDGFSVVAPTSTTVPSSTTGRKLSCWLRLKRWISSMKSKVPCPISPALPRGLEGLLQVGDAGEHRRQLLEMQIESAGEQPRDGGLAGAGRSPQDDGGRAAIGHHAAQRAFRAQQMILARPPRPRLLGRSRSARGRGASSAKIAGFEQVAHSRLIARKGPARDALRGLSLEILA